MKVRNFALIMHSYFRSSCLGYLPRYASSAFSSNQKFPTVFRLISHLQHTASKYTRSLARLRSDPATTHHIVLRAGMHVPDEWHTPGGGACGRNCPSFGPLSHVAALQHPILYGDTPCFPSSLKVHRADDLTVITWKCRLGSSIVLQQGASNFGSIRSIQAPPIQSWDWLEVPVCCPSDDS